MPYVPFATLKTGDLFLALDRDGQPVVACMKIAPAEGCGYGVFVARGDALDDNMGVNAVALGQWNKGGVMRSAGTVVQLDGNECVLLDA